MNSDFNFGPNFDKLLYHYYFIADLQKLGAGGISPAVQTGLVHEILKSNENGNYICIAPMAYMGMPNIM